MITSLFLRCFETISAKNSIEVIIVTSFFLTLFCTAMIKNNKKKKKNVAGEMMRV